MKWSKYLEDMRKDFDEANPLAGSSMAKLNGSLNGSPERSLKCLVKMIIHLDPANYRVDVFIIWTVYQMGFDSDSSIQIVRSGRFDPDSSIRTAQSGQFDSDSLIRTDRSGQFNTDSLIRTVQSGQFDPDSSMRTVRSGQFDPDSLILVIQSGQFDPDSSILLLRSSLLFRGDE